MAITIDQSAIDGIVQKAILDQLSSEQRETIIAAALETLLKERKSGEGYNARTLPSALQAAFDSAVESVCRKVVSEIVEADPQVQAKIASVVGQALLTIDDYNVIPAVSKALGDVLTNSSNRW